MKTSKHPCAKRKECLQPKPSERICKRPKPVLVYPETNILIERNCSDFNDIRGKLTNNIKTIATSFCSFFTNIASTLKLNAAPLKNIVCSNPKQNYPKTYLTFRFKDVQEKEVPKF